jgi:hypothetical protein
MFAAHGSLAWPASTTQQVRRPVQVQPVAAFASIVAGWREHARKLPLIPAGIIKGLHRFSCARKVSQKRRKSRGWCQRARMPKAAAKKGAFVA